MFVLDCVLFLFVAAFCAYCAERLFNTVPGDLITPVVSGAIGGLLGGKLIGHFGPDFAGIALMPCLIGSTVLALVTCLVIPRFQLNVLQDTSLFKNIFKKGVNI